MPSLSEDAYTWQRSAARSECEHLNPSQVLPHAADMPGCSHADVDTAPGVWRTGACKPVAHRGGPCSAEQGALQTSDLAEHCQLLSCKAGAHC